MDELQFKIIIFGPTDEIFAWWGHAALIVENTTWNFSRVFDWGINSHPNESFIMDFINGEIQYKVTSSSFFSLNRDIDEDRDIVIYYLDLDRNAKEIILSYMENRVLPENRYYDYHEFRDNCATGVRDIINLGTGGQFKAAFNVPGRFSYRQHALRYTWFRPMSDWMISFLMGQNLDEEITIWDEMFLPVEIGRNIVNFSYIDSSGMERELVSSVQLIHSSRNRLPILNIPITTWPFFLAAGLLIMLLLFGIDVMQKKYARLGRITWGLVQGIFGLLFGVLGYILVFGLLMDNDYFQQNINVLFVNPLLLIILPIGILFAANKSIFMDSGKLLRIIWTCVFIAGCFSIILRILPFFFQQNLSVYAFVLPITFAFSYVPQWLFAGIKKCQGHRALIKE